VVVYLKGIISGMWKAEYVKQLHEERAISRRRMLHFFRAFVACRRYSEEFLSALLMS